MEVFTLAVIALVVALVGANLAYTAFQRPRDFQWKLVLAGAWTCGVFCYYCFLISPAAFVGGLDPAPGGAVIACFFVPIFWPLAAAHVLYFLGMGGLLLSRWRFAWICGVIAFGIGAVYGIPWLLKGTYGQVFKLAAMTNLFVAGLICDWRSHGFRQKRLAEFDGIGPDVKPTAGKSDSRFEAVRVGSNGIRN